MLAAVEWSRGRLDSAGRRAFPDATVVTADTMVRSISRIDDYKMVSDADAADVLPSRLSRRDSCTRNRLTDD